MREPCLGCGEETATGSAFYSDRHVVTRADGEPTYLCSACNARIRSARTGERLTDDEVRNLVENGTAAAYLWGNIGSVPS